MDVLNMTLSSNRAPHGQPANFVSMKGGRFMFSGKYLDTFWHWYNEAMKEIEQSGGENPSLCEIPIGQSVLRLDVDIERVKEQYIDENNDQELLQLKNELSYTEEELALFVKLVNQTLLEKLSNIDPNLIKCIVFEKNIRIKIEKEGELTRKVCAKRGFHLMYPLIVTNTSDQFAWIEYVIERSKSEQMFSYLDKSPIDKMSSEVAWALYGSCKPDQIKDDQIIKHEPYKISKAYDWLGNLIDIDSVLNEIKIVNTIGEVVDANICQKLTIRPCGRKCQVFLPMETIRVAMKKNNIEDIKIDTNVNYDQIEALVDMLSPERSEDYSLWIGVGKCLASITDGSEMGFEIFDKFSQQCVYKYCPSQTRYKWDSFRRHDTTIALLRRWAMTDNREKYEAWKVQEHKKLMMGLMSTTSGEIARFSSALFGEQFKFSESKWYQFRNHLWVLLDAKCEGTIPIKQELNGKIRLMIKEHMDSLPFDDKIARGKLNEIINKLDEENGLAGVIKMMQLNYSSINFAEDLDTNPFLIGVKNGVIDLKEGVFREGRPEDMISKTLNCEFVEFDENGPEMEEMKIYFMKMFPVEDLREYMLDIMSQVFVGNKYLKNIFFWVGSGDNGKSIFTRLFEEMLGHDYFVKLPTTLLTGQRADAGKAAPELCLLKGKRMGVFEEPEHAETISNGITKSLSGKDSIIPRDLFQTSKQMKAFTPMAQLHFVGNSLPNVKNGADVALWNRIVVIYFMSTFSHKDDVPETFEEQLRKRIFEKDVDFMSKIDKLKPILLYYLFLRWCKIKHRVHLIKPPSCVLKASDDYRTRCDMLKMFCREYLEEDLESCCDLTTFKDQYHIFISSRDFSAKPITTPKLIEELRKIGMVVKDNGIVGYKRREDEE